MGNNFRNITTKTVGEDNDPPDPIRIRSASSMRPEPIISIPTDVDVSQSEEKRIRFRVRHAATDFPATVEAHRDHRISTLKRYLIGHMEMPFPSEDGKCKILTVWNKPSLQRDESVTVEGQNRLQMNERYMGGSIDHLRLSEYGLENGDFLMFNVVFPQILNASANSLKYNKGEGPAP